MPRDAPLPFVSHALTRRLETAAATYMLGWLESGRARPGNPNGLDLTRFGGSTAASATAAPEVDFMNRVYGLRPEDRAHIPAILDHYRARGVRPWFETAPAEGAEALADALWRGGAAPTGTLAMLYGRPDASTAGALPADTTVLAVEDGDQEARERFGRTLAGGHGVPEEHLDEAGRAIAAWPRRADWRLYTAEVGGRPAAAAALVMVDGLGYLANASTLPWARGRGLQAALVRRRIADARGAGCEMVSSLAEFDGPSARNLQRAGLRLACLVTEWRVRPPALSSSAP